MGRRGGEKGIGLLLFLFGLWMWVPLAWSAGPPQRENVELISQVGGSALSVFVQGKVAYVGLGSSLHVVDVSNPGSPQALGQVTLPGLVEDIFVAGSLAYVANGKFGLRVVDLSTPTSPQEIGRLDTLGGYARGVFFSGGFAYVASGTEGLWVIDVSDPANPVQRGQQKVEGLTANGVNVSGSFAYVAAGVGVIGGELQILDISNPDLPLSKSSFPLPSVAYGVHVLGNFAYVANGLGGLRAVDVSKPDAPQKAATYGTPDIALRVYVSLPYAYVADAKGGLRVINMENPAFFWEVGHLNTPGFNWDGSALGIYGVGSTVYVANGDFGLAVIDVSSPSAPGVLGEYKGASGLAGSVADVFISGIYAYLPAFDYAFQIADFSNLLSPVFKGFYDPPPPTSAEHDPPGLNISSLFVTDDWVGIADGGTVSADGQQYGFRAVQVKDPSAPFEDPAWTQHVPGLGILNPVQGPATDVFLISFSRVPISPPRTDILAYMATPEGLTVVDMGPLPTPPPNVLPVPVKLGSYPAEGARKVFVAANTTATYAYLVGDFGLKILDVTNSANIAEVGSLSTGSTPATSIFVNLPYAYVTVDSELWVIQVYDLAAGRPFASPQRIYDPIPLEGEATGIFFSGSSAYVTLSGFGLKVFDFTDPLVRPVSPVAVYETPGQAMDLFIDQGRIYLADGDGGLFILRYPIGPNVKKIGNVKKMGNLPHSSNDPKQPSAKMAVSAPALDAPQIVLDPTALDFGDVALASSIDLPLTISNAGTQPLTVSSLQLGGAEASQYSLVNPPALPFTLAPNASQSLTVRFSPTTAGSKAASLTFASNDPDEASVQVALSGWGGLVPDIAVEPVALDFGDVEVGASKDLQLTVSNPGAKELIVSSLQFGGANGSEFSLVGAVALPLTLAPGASQLLTVRFSPMAAGARSGTLTLTSNDPNQSTVSVSLSGGDAPDIDLLPVDDKGKPVLDFTDNLQVGKFEEKTLTIKNVGSQPLTVTSLTVTSLAVDNAFSLVGDVSVPFDVPTGGERTVTVRFSPIKDGGNANKGTLTIESNDPDESSVDVELKGWGPHITLEPDELDFGTVSPGTSEDRLLTVTNTGAEDLIVDHVTLGKDDPPDPSDDPSVFSLVGLVGPFKLAPGAFRILTVRFSPISESEDPKTATLTFTSNDSDRKTGKVELSGRGLNAPQITLDLLSDEVLDDPQNLLLDFGTVSTSESKDLTITVTNAGNKDLEVTSLEVGGTNASDFFVVSPAAPKFTLKPGDPPQTITVRFSPISESKDPKTATLIIRSNDPDHDENPKGELPIQVRLSGIAQNAPHIVLDTRVLNFGKVMVRSSKDLTVTVSNEGSQNLIVDPMRLTQFERGTGEFSLEGFKQVGFTLTPKGTPGASQTITVRFKPTSKGTNGGFLDFFSNDPLRPLIWTTLLGEGVDQPQITLDLDSKDPKDVLDFGDVGLGSSKDLSLSVSNTGTQDLTVSFLELAGEEFSLVGGVIVPFTLKPGDPPKTVTVRFSPTQEGSKTGSLTFVSNDPDRRRAEVTLSGWSPEIVVEPDALDFGNVAPGAIHDLPLTVTNTGAKDLKVTSLMLEGSDFSLVGAVTIPFTLAPGKSQTLTLRFRPDIDGDRTGKLTLESNDPKRPKVDVVLSGHGGLVPRIEFDPPSLTFQTVRVGVAEELSVKVFNEGVKDLNVTSLSIEGADFSLVEPPVTPFTLTPKGSAGDSKTLKVRFRPVAGGTQTRTGNLVFESNDPKRPTARVSLSGESLDAPQITFTPSPLDFGVLPLGRSGSRDLTVSNTGTQDLKVTSLTLEGSDFSLVEPPSLPFTLRPVESKTLKVRFSPTTKGSKTGSLTFESNDPNKSTSVSLSGWGELEAAQISLAPDALDFGDVPQNDDDSFPFRDLSFRVTNTGTVDLEVESLEITGEEFSLTGTVTLPFTLKPEESKTLTVRFSPTTKGHRTGTLTLSSSDSKGHALTAQLAMSGRGGLVPHLAFDPLGASFGDVLVGNTKEIAVRVSNAGAKDLIVSSLGLGGPDASDFSLVEPPATPFTLPPKESKVLTVRFLPTTEGAREARLTASSNDPDQPTAQTTLSGKAVTVPRIEVDSEALDFQDVPLGSFQDLSLKVSNPGTQDLIVSSLDLVGGEFSLVEPPALPFTLKLGASQDITVRFSPTTEGPKQGTLTLHSNDPSRPSVAVSLSATPIAPDIQVEPTELDFGNVSVNNHNDLSLTVSNLGLANLEVKDVKVDPGAGEFSLVSGPIQFTLAPRKSQTLTVRFLPTSEGPKQATMTLRSNDPDQPKIAVPLSGNAILAGQGPPLRKQIELISQVGGSSKAIFVQGKVAYVGLGSSLHLVDVQDPENPKLLGRVALPGLVEDIFVSTSLRAYVANGRFGLRVIDVSNPTSPREEGHFDTLGDFAFGVYVLGTYAYVANGGKGLRVIDVSEPTNPRLVGSGLDTPGTAYDVSVSGSDAYVADGEGGLRVVDISNPRDPVEKGSYKTVGLSTGVHVLGSYAYLADGAGGLRVIDISDPTSPVKVGSYDTPGTAYRVFVSFPYAYMADRAGGLRVINVGSPSQLVEVGFHSTAGHAVGVFASGTMAYMAVGDFGMEIIDLSNPTVPVSKGKYSFAIGSATDVFISGRHAYLPGRGYGFRIVDISDPFTPEARGLHNPPPPIELPKMSAASLFVTDTWAGVADHSGLYRMVDVTDPLAPVEDQDLLWADAVPGALDGFLLSRTLVPSSPDVDVYMVGEDGLVIDNLRLVVDNILLTRVSSYSTVAEISGAFVVGSPGTPDSLAYAAAGRGGLKVVDISNSKSPIELSQLDTPGFAKGVFVSGSHAYVADGDGGLRIIDISQPSFPQEVGSHANLGETAGVFVRDRYAYVADGGGGMAVLDISRPSTLVERGRFPSMGYTSEVTVSQDGKYAYVADGGGGLLILDVSNPLSATFLQEKVSRLDVGGYASGLYLSGTLVYVASGSGGLVVVDVSDPAAPKEVERFDMPGFSSGVHVAIQDNQTYAYVANKRNGLSVVKVSNPFDPTLLRLEEVTSFATTDARKVFFAGSQVFVSDGKDGLKAIDVSRPTSPQLVGRLGALGAPRKIFVSTNSSFTYAYLAGDFGLLILDVTDTTAPRFRGRLSLGTPATGIFVSFPYAYLLTKSGLWVVDVSDPTRPTLLKDYKDKGSIPISRKTAGIFVAGPLAYVAVGGFGLQVFDFTDPQVRPETWVAAYETPGEGMDVFVDKGRIYLADGDGGLFILRHTLPIGGDVAIDPSSLDFGRVDGGTMRDQTFVIKNEGKADLTVTSLLIDQAEFSVVSMALPFTLAPGFSQTVTVRFSPTTNGSKRADLTILSNDPDEPTLKMQLSGEGLPAADLAIDPPSLDFGEVGLGTPQELSFKVINQSSDSPLEVKEICLEGEKEPDGLCTTGAQTSPFSRVGEEWSTLPFTLPPNGSKVLKVRFAPVRSSSPPSPILPEDLGPKRSVMKIVSNDPESNRRESPKRVPLKGTAVKPPDIHIDPSNLDFGEVAIGNRGELSLAISNEGAADLIITGIPSNNDQFFAEPSAPLPVTLKPGGGQKLEVVVRFTPSTQPKEGAQADEGPTRGEGPQRGTITVLSNDPEITFHQNLVIASGAGIQLHPLRPDLHLSLVKKNEPSPCGDPSVKGYWLDFGGIPVNSGRSKELSFTLFNDGTSRLKVTNVSFSGEGFTLISPAATPTEKSPLILTKGGGSQRVTVKFTPATSGCQMGQITIANNDPEEPEVVVRLLGSGTQLPDIHLDPSALSFGPVALGDSKDLSFTVRNLGSAPLSVNRLSIDNPQFKVVSEVPSKIDPGDLGEVTVRFTPTTAQTQGGTLSLVSNDPDEGTATLVLSGNDATVKLLIDGGSPSTGQPKVTLTISAAPEIQKMRFSNDRKKWSPWIKVAASKRWTLSKGLGTKTVWGQFKGKDGQAFEASDTIVQTKKTARKE